MKYNAATLRYFETPATAGELAGPDTYRGAAGDRATGTWVQFDLRVLEGRIETARFLAHGCPHIIAASAWVAEHAAGQVLKTALPDGIEGLSRRFEVPVEKRGRLLVIEDAWKAAAGGPTAR